MKPSEILIKPIITEKANAQQESLRRYAFKVARKSNKLEIKKAIEAGEEVPGARLIINTNFKIK